ncbi:MAG: hypothetical protein JWO05_3633 [Gemmatimonadetes bacterium]|nr:hypothetical protein [Gemmatimonadota bacterium]
MRRTRLALAAFLSTLALAAPATAGAQAAHPDFSGTWVMDVAKSDQGPGVPPALTMVVDQKGDAMLLRREVELQTGPQVVNLKYTLDGKLSANHFVQAASDVDAETVVSWAGETPTFSTTLHTGGQEISQVDHWTMSDAGKTLTIKREMKVGDQSIARTMILARKG